MSNIIKLIKGELVRLYKYKIVLVGMIVSIIWVTIIALSDKNSIENIIPMLIFMDAGMMSILLMSASFFLEKQEGSIKSLLVTPIKLVDVLFSKVISIIILSIISTTLVVLAAIIFHKTSVNILSLYLYVIIIVTSHLSIGLVITLFSKDFGAMIGIYAGFAFISLIPSIFYTLGIIPNSFGTILLISPSHAGQMLLNSSFTNVDLLVVIVSLLYLIILPSLLYPLVIFKKYRKYTIEEW